MKKTPDRKQRPDKEQQMERIIADNLRARRALMQREYGGYTQDEAAEVAGVSRTAYSHYETGERRPSSVQLFALAEWLRVDINYFADKVSPDEMMCDELASAYAALETAAKSMALTVIRSMHRNSQSHI